MKNTTRATHAMALGLILTASTAHALQFKIPGLDKANASTGTATTQDGDAAVAQDTMIRTFVASQLEVLAAQTELAQAYDLKDQVAILESEKTTLSGGGTLEAAQLETSMDRSRAANEAIAAKQTEQATLSNEGKQHYAASLPHFARGVIGTRELVMQAGKFGSSLKSSMGAGGLAGLAGGANKLKAGMVIVKGTPGYSKSVFDMFRKTLTIGQSNGVKAPTDATAALSGLAP
jgi:hypothetical protein